MLNNYVFAQTGKPGSVCDDHLSRPYISAWLKPSPQARGPRLSLFPRRCSGWGLQGRYVSITPVSSYLAFSSLPMRAVFFSVALSLKLPSPGVTRHPVLRSPDFPHAPDFRPAAPAIVSVCGKTLLLYSKRLSNDRSLFVVIIHNEFERRELF